MIDIGFKFFKGEIKENPLYPTKFRDMILESNEFAPKRLLSERYNITELSCIPTRGDYIMSIVKWENLERMFNYIGRIASPDNPDLCVIKTRYSCEFSADHEGEIMANMEDHLMRSFHETNNHRGPIWLYNPQTKVRKRIL